MHVYEASELADALKEVGVTEPAIVDCKSTQIDDAALLFLTRRQAESDSPPHKVINELGKISNAARKLSLMLREGADPDYVLDEGHPKRAANGRLQMVSNRISEKLGELSGPQLAAFMRCWCRREPQVEVTDTAFDIALEAVAFIQAWADGARILEERRKLGRRSRSTREADDALNEFIDRLVEISEYGPKTSEPSSIERDQGKTDPFGPLIRYINACLEPLRKRDPAVRKLTAGGVRGRTRRPVNREADDPVL